MASHLLYTQRGILCDQIPEERALGIKAGLEWLSHADVMAIYFDRGISNGMRGAEFVANRMGIAVEYRSLDKKPNEG